MKPAIRRRNGSILPRLRASYHHTWWDSHVVPQHPSSLGRVAASVHADVGDLAVLLGAKDANRCRHSMAQLRSLNPRATLAAAKTIKTVCGYVLL